jgi:hypothetical protein
LGSASVKARNSRRAVRAVIYAGDLSARNFFAYDCQGDIVTSCPQRANFTHGEFVQPTLKRVVRLPETLHVVERDADCALIRFPQGVRLLLFFPCVFRLLVVQRGPRPITVTPLTDALLIKSIYSCQTSPLSRSVPHSFSANSYALVTTPRVCSAFGAPSAMGFCRRM